MEYRKHLLLALATISIGACCITCFVLFTGKVKLIVLSSAHFGQRMVSNTQASFRPRNCSMVDFKSIKSVLSPKARMRESRCPEATWLSEFYISKHLANRDIMDANVLNQRKFLAINVGCNKGYDAVEIMRMGSANTEFDVKNWTKTIKKIKGQLPQGVCGQHNLSPLQIPKGVPVVENAMVYCVEPMSSNIKMVRKVASSIGLDAKGLVMTQAAVSSSTGKVSFPKARPGAEAFGIKNCMNRPKDYPGCQEVEMVTLDDFYRANIPKQVNGADQYIDVLLIDTEGHDYEVLKAARSALSRTRYLEFEFHSFKPWIDTPLLKAIDYLSRLDFTCYWALKQRLLRITNCYMNQYSKHHWSNIACVKNSEIELAKHMESNFENAFLNQNVSHSDVQSEV